MKLKRLEIENEKWKWKKFSRILEKRESRWSLSQPFVFRPDRIGGFVSNELAMYSGLFWNKEAFSFRSRLPKLVSILLPLISFQVLCQQSTIKKAANFPGFTDDYWRNSMRVPFAKTRMESFEIFFTLINISFGAIWGHSTVLNNSKTRQNREKGRE